MKISSTDCLIDFLTQIDILTNVQSMHDYKS